MTNQFSNGRMWDEYDKALNHIQKLEDKLNKCLVEFTLAERWDEKVYVNALDVSVIKRYHKDRDMGEYSELIMSTGERVVVCGLPTMVAQKIREARA